MANGENSGGIGRSAFTPSVAYNTRVFTNSGRGGYQQFVFGGMLQPSQGASTSNFIVNPRGSPTNSNTMANSTNVNQSLDNQSSETDYVWNSLNSRPPQEPIAPYPSQAVSRTYPTIQASRNYGNMQAFANTARTNTNSFEESPIDPGDVAVDDMFAPVESASEVMTEEVAESATGELLSSTVSNPVANLAGIAIGQGIAHAQDINLSSANTQLNATYNSAQRSDQLKEINSIQNTASYAQTGAAIGSVIPVVGSSIGAAIGTAIGTSEQTQGSDLSSPEETAQL